MWKNNKQEFRGWGPWTHLNYTWVLFSTRRCHLGGSPVSAGL